MSNALKTDDSGEKWEALVMCVFFMCGAAVWIATSMIRADQYSDCTQRGGQMVKVDGERVCKVERGSDGR